MKKFKDLFLDKDFLRSVDIPSVKATLNSRTLYLRFDSKDVVVSAGYQGEADPWLGSLCFLVEGKTLGEVSLFTWETWKKVFKTDQTFWDFFQDVEEDFFSYPLELLKVSLDLFGGREYLYEDPGPLVCRCFGIREADILDHLRQEGQPTLDTLSGSSRAGMACRSCVPQLKRWFEHDKGPSPHFYKQKPAADWILEIDSALSKFPVSQEWGMEVTSLKGNQAFISFSKDVTQKEEEEMGRELQSYLGASVDVGFGFFLRRARHCSNAKG